MNGAFTWQERLDRMYLDKSDHEEVLEIIQMAINQAVVVPRRPQFSNLDNQGAQNE